MLSSTALEYATLAQLVERLIRNEQVIGSSPMGGSSFSRLVPGQDMGTGKAIVFISALLCPIGQGRGTSLIRNA